MFVYTFEKEENGFSSTKTQTNYTNLLQQSKGKSKILLLFYRPNVEKDPTKQEDLADLDSQLKAQPAMAK